MNLIEIIKQIWRRKNIKALPSPKKELNKNKGNKGLFYNYGKRKKEFQIETKVNQNIENFLKAYLNQINQNPGNKEISNYELAYIALITLNGRKVTEDEYRINQDNETNLLNDPIISERYTCQCQKMPNNNVTSFYHIKSKDYKKIEHKDMMRIYLNCNNKNIAELAKEILNFNSNPNFYMKFTANDRNKEFPRGEKIVIYCHKNDLENNIGLLEYIKKIRPDLFEENEKILPFFKNKNNIASIAKQPETDEYMNLQGNSTQIYKTPNAFLTMILRESYFAAAREVARQDKNLDFLLERNNMNNETLYVRNYPYIDYYYHDYLIKSMKAKMEVLGKKNNIYIDGIYTPQIVESKNNERESRSNE